MKTNKLQFRITLIVGAAVTVIFAVVIFFITISANKIVMGDALKATQEKAASYAKSIDEFMNEGVYTARSLAKSFEAYPSIPVNQRREAYAQILKKSMNLNTKFKSVWIIFEPNAIDNNDAFYKNTQYSNNAGRFVATFYREEDKIKISIDSEEKTLAADYYIIPKKKNKEVILEPYKFKYTENGPEYYETSICEPIRDVTGKFIGVVGIDIDLSEMQSFIIKEKQIMAIFSNEGKVVAHFDSTRIDRQLIESEEDMIGTKEVKKLAADVKKGKVFSLTFFAAAINSEAYIVVTPIKIGDTGQPWGFGFAIPLDVAFAKTHGLQFTVITITIIGLLILLFILAFLIKGISKPIIEASNYAGKIANGDLTATMKITRNDEIGKMVEALQTMGKRLSDIVSQVMEATENVATGTSQISTIAQQVAQGASEQAASSEEVSASIEEMSATIEQNSENANQTERIAKEAFDGIMEVANAAQQSLDATNKVNIKITAVNDIAEKTDILAINAAIEAARAGEHGKGFAVVAAEIRKLAEISQKAAKEINEISHFNSKITTDAGLLMQNVIPKIQKTSQLVKEIAAASGEQNTGAQQIVKAIEQLSQVTQQNSAAAEEMSSGSEELSSQAEALKDVMSFFKIQQQIGVKKHILKPDKNFQYKDKLRPSNIELVLAEKKKDDEYESF